MKQIRQELEDILKDRLNKDAFDQLWKDFQILASICRAMGGKRIKHYVLPPDYKTRFEALRSALAALQEEDLHMLYAYSEVRISDCAEVKSPQPGSQRFMDLMSIIKNAAEMLRDQKPNPRHRPSKIDLPMQAAIALWLRHVDKTPGASEEGPFARFSKLFMKAIDPESEDYLKSVLRRIRSARDKQDENFFLRGMNCALYEVDI